MYSPIKNIYIKNFRNIGEANISFEQSPIVCLVGENEAGKTSVIKAFATCALHANPREQKDYIRQGTQMFGVVIELQDGSSVTRLKTSTLNKYQVIRPDGTKWETTKISEGLPVEVQKIMGLIEEPETKEFLHIRTYEDKLLFVVTPASTNYKVMYDALKVDQLTKAIKKGSIEVNEIRGRLGTNEISIQTLYNSAQSVNIVDIEPLIDVKSRLNKQLSLLDKLDKAMSLSNAVKEGNDKLGILRLISTFKLEEIDIYKAYNLDSINKYLTSIQNLKDCREKVIKADSCEEISLEVISKIDSLRDKIKELKTKKDSAGALIHVSEISEISEGKILQLERASDLIKTINTYKQKLTTMDISSCNEISQVDIDSINKLIKIRSIIESNKQHEQLRLNSETIANGMLEKLKELGVAFETCPNCGNDVLIDIDKIK